MLRSNVLDLESLLDCSKEYLVMLPPPHMGEEKYRLLAG